MELLTGKFEVTLDEKSRISLPFHLRRILNDAEIILVENYYEECLWLFPKDNYLSILEKFNNSTNFLLKEDREFLRRYYDFISVVIDKAGRIPIAQNYRKYAKLIKECIVLGQGKYIEIWDKELYNIGLEKSNDNFMNVSNEIGNKIKNQNGGNER